MEDISLSQWAELQTFSEIFANDASKSKKWVFPYTTLDSELAAITCSTSKQHNYWENQQSFSNIKNARRLL